MFGLVDVREFPYFQIHPQHPHLVLWGPEYQHPHWHNDGDASQMMPTITERWEPADTLPELVEMDKYKFLGNVHRSDFEYSDRSELLPLYLSDGVAQGEDGGGVPVYKEANVESKVVKTLKSGTKVQYEYDFASQMNIIYEADGKGGYKVAGYVPMELIQFESTEMETP